MIIEVEGDILKTSADAIVHGVAPNDNFHQGLALSLREQWPSLYKDFRHYCQSRHPKAGELWSWKGAGGPVVVSLFTQQAAYDSGSSPGKATLENVNHCLRELRKEVEQQKLTSLAITRVATGVGGLNFKDVRPLLDKHLGDLKIPIFLYVKFHAGQKAAENVH